jgi:hypothetical protein
VFGEEIVRGSDAATVFMDYDAIYVIGETVDSAPLLIIGNPRCPCANHAAHFCRFPGVVKTVVNNAVSLPYVFHKPNEFDRIGWHVHWINPLFVLTIQSYHNPPICQKLLLARVDLFWLLPPLMSAITQATISGMKAASMIHHIIVCPPPADSLVRIAVYPQEVPVPVALQAYAQGYGLLYA